MPDPTLKEVARRLDVSPKTLRRWVDAGIVEPVAAGRRRRSPRRGSSRGCGARGHSLDQLREAARSGRLAFGYLEDLFPETARTRTLAEAAQDTGLEPALIERIWATAGFSAASLDGIGEEDMQLLRYLAAVLSAGLPEVAFLQLVRVYGQALARIADAEVRLFHLYVHEPLIQEGMDPLEIAEAMERLAGEMLPLASPIMDQVHRRALHHFIAEDVVGHLEAEVGRRARPHARGDRVRRPRGLHAADRGGRASSRRSTSSSASSRTSSRRCPRART